MPSLNYRTQSSDAISADYIDMPATAQIVLVNNTSGASIGSPTALAGSGKGTVMVPIDFSIPGGDYFLRAQDASTKAFIAQTVKFYIGDASKGQPS